MELFGLMKLKEFAQSINTPESTVRTWRRRKEIPENCFKVIGNTVFVRIKEAKAFMEA